MNMRSLAAVCFAFALIAPVASADDDAAPAAASTQPSTQPATQPSTQPRDDADFDLLRAIDERAAKIETFTADFVQHKHALLLRKPLVSKGSVRMKGGVIRWDTAPPHATALTIERGRVSLYYPAQNTMESYDIGSRMTDLFASPVPRLEVLRQYFAIQQQRDVTPPATQPPATHPSAERDVEPSDEKPKDDQAADTAPVQLKLLPKDARLSDRMDHLLITLDAARGFATRMEMIDPDGERTVITFSNVRINPEVDGDLAIKPPAGTRAISPANDARNGDAEDDPDADE